MTVRHTVSPSVLGDLLLVADGPSVTGVYFDDHRYPPHAGSTGERVDIENDPLLSSTAQQLTDYLAGERTEFDLDVAPTGSALSERVWQLLREIPYGETTTYGRLAEQLGNRSLAQAVGQAVGHNPVSIIIACHRVVGADGKLTGYAGGIERKRFLLHLEEPESARASQLF